MSQQALPTFNVGVPGVSGSGDSAPVFGAKMNTLSQNASSNFTDLYTGSAQYNTNIVFAGANNATNSWIFQPGQSISGKASAAPNGNLSPFNLYVSGDTVDTTTIGPGLLSLLSVEIAPQAGHTGARNAIFGYTGVVGSPAAIPTKGYCGVQSRTICLANLGGVAGSFSTYGGSIFGGNSDAQAKNGSTYVVSCIGHEIDCIITAGANAAEKLGLSIVQTSIDVNRGDYDDDAIRIANQDGAGTTWKYGLAFGAYGHKWAFGADSTLIYAWTRQVGSASPAIALTGIDFRNVTFQVGGFAFATNGLTVDPNGCLSITNQGTATPAIAVVGVANQNVVQIQAANSSNTYAVSIKAGTGTGSSFGVSIAAGTNNSDIALLVRDQTNTHNYLQVFGDGHMGLGYNGSGTSVTIASTGQVQLNAPSAGANMLITGLAAGAACIRINTAANTGAQTATFSATNKPGSGTTAPGTWLPINLDGTIYYIPCWT
jgi:hypothetical protein